MKIIGANIENGDHGHILKEYVRMKQKGNWSKQPPGVLVARDTKPQITRAKIGHTTGVPPQAWSIGSNSGRTTGVPPQTLLGILGDFSSSN